MRFELFAYECGGEGMTTDEHRARHACLHRALDELLADWLDQTLPRYGEPRVQPFGTERPIADLMAWSYAQTQHPTLPRGEMHEETAEGDAPPRPGPAPRLAIRIQPTDQLTGIEGVLCRVWQGMTDEGVPCVVFVRRVAVAEGEDSAAFEAALQAQLPPGRVVDLRTVL
jgi:hypothetical protein